MVSMFSQVGTLAGVWKSQPGEGHRSGAGAGMVKVTSHKTKGVSGSNSSLDMMKTKLG